MRCQPGHWYNIHTGKEAMSFENQLGSVIARVRTIEAQMTAIELDFAIEKAKLQAAVNDLKIIQDQLKPKQ